MFLHMELVLCCGLHSASEFSDFKMGVTRRIVYEPCRMPAIGKNPPYVATFAIFVILTVPTALTDSFAGLLVLRFLLGFFGKCSKYLWQLFC